MGNLTTSFLLKLFFAAMSITLLAWYGALFAQNMTNWGWYQLNPGAFGLGKVDVRDVVVVKYQDKLIPGAVVLSGGEERNVLAVSADYVVHNHANYDAEPLTQWSSNRCDRLSWWSKHVRFRNRTACYSQRYGHNVDERVDVNVVQTANGNIFVHTDYRTSWGLILMAPAMYMAIGTAALAVITVANACMAMLRQLFDFGSSTNFVGRGQL